MRGPSLDLKPQILDRIKAAPDVVWTPIDFLDIGARAAVDKALQRLVQARELCRLDRGIYHRPLGTDVRGGATAPYIGAVINAVGRRDQTRLLIDGLTAAKELGLTNDAPAEIVVFSDARLRPVKLGNQTITFKQAAPSKLFWAGRPAMRIIQALHWMQELILAENVGEATKRFRDLLSRPAEGQVMRDDLLSGLHTLPIWMQKYLRSILEDTDPVIPLPLGRPLKR